MPDNFLGLPFDDWVTNQINKRQEVLGKNTNIPTADLQFYNTKTPFLRLASSVNVTKNGVDGIELEESVYKKLQRIGYDENIFSGDELAKNCILQGGVINLNEEGSISELKSGLNKGSSILKGAYGWGGLQERGFVPMPGLINSNVQYYGDGALYKAVVNIKCFSKSQFNLIDVLYLRLGYTVLLEFGWSQYLDTENDGQLVNFDTFKTAPLSKLLAGSSDQFEMYNLIKNERKLHSGNYEAIYGKVSSFNWNFNTDGSYDCALTITGMGDLIESLKVNITNPGTNLTETIKIVKKTSDVVTKVVGGEESESWAELPLVANATKTVINEFLYKIYASNFKLPVPTGNLNAASVSLSDITITNFRSEKGETPKDITHSNSVLTIQGVELDQGTKPISPQTYIKYGAFLSFIQADLLLYDSKSDTPVVVFDMDLENIDEDETVILRVPGQFSADPRVCLVPYSNTNEQTEGILQSQINEKLKSTKFFYDTYLGRLSNIFLNVNYIAQIMDSAPKDPETGALSLLQLLKQINKGVINALGGINSFDIKLSDNMSKIRFIEEIPQRFTDENTNNGEYARFNIFGVKPGVEGSFVRDLNLNAETSGDLSSLIVIGSQANSNQISANATAFGNYSAGLEDRVIPTKESYEPKPGGDTTVPQTIKSNFETNIQRKGDEQSQSLFSLIYNQGKWISENITPFLNHNQTHASLVLGDLTTPSTDLPQLAAPFFLPFTFNMTIDGLSGMKLYEKFLITDDVLPPSYDRESVDLQIRGLNHSIDPSAWTTQVEAFSVPANKNLAAPKRPAQLLSEDTTQYGTGGTGGALPNTVLNAAPESTDPTSVARFDAMKKSFNGVFGRDGAVSGMCAQWSYNLAVNYVEFLNGRSLSNPKLRAGGNANQNNEFFNNLTKIGYTKTVSTGLSRAQVNNQLKTTTWGYGDVVVYYANDGDINASHRKYGHAQIYVGSLVGSKWSTSTVDNYGTDFVYRSRPSNNWNFLIFRAPSS
jgi:hypothetical protein